MRNKLITSQLLGGNTACSYHPGQWLLRSFLITKTVEEQARGPASFSLLPFCCISEAVVMLLLPSQLSLTLKISLSSSNYFG